VSDHTFIFGAGFNADAWLEAGQQSDLVKYPLVNDLLETCFGLKKLPLGVKSIEEMFQQSIDQNELKPISTMYRKIQEADYDLTYQLFSRNSSYRRFLNDFPMSGLITFNYDSLIEVLLLYMGEWRPEDGYGVVVDASPPRPPRGTPRQVDHPITQTSKRYVLHLHGCLCVYEDSITQSYDAHWKLSVVDLKSPPDFVFDPDTIGDRFRGFGHSRIGYIGVEKRVIAPIPDKVRDIQKLQFVQDVAARALSTIANTTGSIIVIGYSFNPADDRSYVPLLKAVDNRQILIIAPDAKTSVRRLASKHPDLNLEAKDMTFRQWCDDRYPGL